MKLQPKECTRQLFTLPSSRVASLQQAIENGAETNSMCNEIFGNLYLEFDVNSIVKSDNILNGKYLLLITERWDESMLVLKYAYNLSFDDIVYITDLKKDRNPEQMISDNDKHLSTEYQNVIYNLNNCDWKLYKIANEILDHRLFQIYGNDTQKMKQDNKTIYFYRNQQIESCEIVIIHHCCVNLLSWIMFLGISGLST